MILIGRVLFHEGDRLTLEMCRDGELELDRTHVFKCATTPAETQSATMLTAECDDVIVNVSVMSMFGLYRFWKAGDLRQIARIHGIRLVARDTKISIQEKLAFRIAQKAQAAAVDMKRMSPFGRELLRWYPGESWQGGKVDDIAVIVAVVVDA